MGLNVRNNTKARLGGVAQDLGKADAFVAYQVRLIGPIQGLMGLYASIASARISLRRVNEILETPIEVREQPGAVAVDAGPLTSEHR